MNVRITSVTLENFKNVKFGKIALENIRKPYKSSVVGLYGQNGSGKTAFIDALELLRYVLCGAQVPEKFSDYINVDVEIARLTYEFRVETPTCKTTLIYKFEMKSVPDEREQNLDVISSLKKRVLIQKELLKSPLQVGKRNRMGRIIDTDCEEAFLPDTKLQLFSGKTERINILVARRQAETSSRSFIFCKDFLTVIRRQVQSNNNPELKFYVSLIESLVEFGNYSLFTVNTSNSGLISLNAHPFIFKQERAIRTLMLPIERPITLGLREKELVEQVISSINVVLPQIVPGLTIGASELGTQIQDNGELGYIVQLTSRKNRIALKNESEGIKKIISILHLLIQVYNQSSITVAIDELDTGIFEYLLGELLRIISEKGKGQLIFTSHNLRPLETIDRGFVVFTTTNPNRRYVRMTNVKSNNNLRDFYYRDIMLGEQSEELYKAKNNAEIAFAFREAGEYDAT